MLENILIGVGLIAVLIVGAILREGLNKNKYNHYNNHYKKKRR